MRGAQWVPFGREFCNGLAVMRDALWSLSARELSNHLDARALRSREIVDAYLARIETFNPSLRAYTEVFSVEARREAELRDQERDAGQRRGPLHGVPVSIKECFDLEGLASTLGLESRLGQKARRDAAMVTLLREAGAVILGRTNLSQTMLFSESRNPLYGQTANPFSSRHTPGGSSGGEAAAIAAGLSPLGLGTDIGGSIRSPCHFSGICGLKPTLDRLPMLGVATVLKGQEAVRSQCGPMARTVDDLVLFFEALSPERASALDPRVPPLPMQVSPRVDARGLRVGYYAEDGVLPVSRAVARAVDVTRALLAERGAKLVPFTPPDVPALFDRYLRVVSADGGQNLLEAVGKGEIDPSLKGLARIVKMSPAVRSSLARAAALAGQARAAKLLEGVGEKTVAAYWQLIDQLRAHRARVIDAMARTGVDVIVCPAFATPALPHGMSKNFTPAAAPAITWNALQFPAGVVPVTRVRSDEIERPHPRDMVERHAARVDRESAGLPVGVQVVARPWDDARVLETMGLIESALRDTLEYPRTPIEPR